MFLLGLRSQSCASALLDRGSSSLRRACGLTACPSRSDPWTGTANDIDDACRVVGLDITAPRHVPVRAHEDECSLVETYSVRMRNELDVHWHAARARSTFQQVRAAFSELEEHEAISEQVESGPSRGER